MRVTFVKSLVEVAKKDARVVLLTGDLGYTVLEPFIEQFPDRFFNVGVAEQNMVGMATGLAEAGLIPYVYSIVPFATLRPYEFIRNGSMFHQLPVRIVGVGGGFEYGHAGKSHFGIDDIGVMRLQPGITVIAPADYEQTRSAILQTWDLPRPIYYRLGKNEKYTVPNLQGTFDFDQVPLVCRGKDVLLLSIGNTAQETVRAAKLLAEKEVHGSVGIVASFNPSPTQQLKELLLQFPLILSVEAHYTSGGLGSFLAEIIAENEIPSKLIRCGVKQQPDHLSGSETYLLQKHQLTGSELMKTVLTALNK